MPKTILTVNGDFGLHKMLLLKNGFLEKIETWHVGLSCQYTQFMSFSSKSEHDTVADQATLNGLKLLRKYWAEKRFAASVVSTCTKM